MRRLLLTLSLIATPALAGPLTIKGSDTLVGLVQRWASVVMQEDRSLRLQVTGGGSGTGLAALENGSTDIAMSSRPISVAERERLTKRYGAPPQEVAVARDGVAFFVNAENPVRAVTLDELRALFLGDITTWKSLAGVDRVVVLYTRENSSGTHDFVRERLLRGEEFPPRSQPLPGTGAVVNAVSRERWGIGFGGAAFARRVRMLAIADQGKEIHLTPDTVRQGVWPFARPLFFYLPPRPTPEAQRFLDFVLSTRGQQLARAAGFFPL